MIRETRGTVTTVRSAKRKIAVLGGGISALSAVFDLSSAPNWQDKYDITLYQMGWRLGGKGTSSRNPAFHNRIEEHGLHIWLGFYENAFEIMRRCYSELSGVSGIFPSWQDAFKPHSYVVLEDKAGETWFHWPINFPISDSLPGDGLELPTLWDYLVMILQWVADAFQEKQQLIHSDIPVNLSNRTASIMDEETGPREKIQFKTATNLIRAAHKRARKLRRHSKRIERHKEVTSLLDDFSQWLGQVLEKDSANNAEFRRFFVPIDLFCAVARGILADNAILDGLDALDDFEFRDWLTRHGASQLSLSSAPIRGGYDLAFSFEDGDKNKPNIAAGVAVRSLFRMAFTYKGAFLWEMQAGMGETVFTPLYVALRKRGVKFKFFHKVDKLELNSDKSQIERIHISIQATVQNGEYLPLERVGQLDCWRPTPDYGQLKEGDVLRARQVNLESNWSDWRSPSSLTLDAYKDFDEIILGIPIAALKTIGADLADARDDWRAMLRGVKTIRTQGFQVWLNKSLSECGWKLPSPVLSAYVEPIDTWADMTHLLKAEGWTPDLLPKQLAYFVGVMPDPPVIPDPSDITFPAAESERLRVAACDYLLRNAGYLWPDAIQTSTSGFNWDILVADQQATNDKRFLSQYWRANIDPSDRYTLAVAGSTKYRLRVDHSGFKNLVLAGDWTRNGLNTPGCIESAVMSGRQAARTISHTTQPILGETDFPSEVNFLIGIFRRIVNTLRSILRI
jgi:uncharacterized protein with NAD-binding domain and iron-sulfur cluster